MIPNQVQDEFPEAQAAIYRVALSLDALLVNGIQYGVLRGEMFSGFLQTTISNLLRDLSSLEQHARVAPVTTETNVTAILQELRTRCQQVIELVTGLTSFRSLPMEQLRSILSQIPLVRGECVQLIQELEACFRTPKPFYLSRPGHSTATVDGFLANLDQIFAEEREASMSALSVASPTDRGSRSRPTDRV